MDDWVSKYLDALKLRMGFSSDAELAAELGFGKSTLATWRRRGDIPLPALMRIADQAGHDITTGDELLFGLAVSQSATLVRALYSYVVIKYRDCFEVPKEEEFRDLLWWSRVRKPIEEALIPITRAKTKDSYRIADVYDEIRALIDNGELLTLEQILAFDPRDESEEA